MTTKLGNLHRVVNDMLEDVSKLFNSPDVKLTFIARTPGKEEADVLITDDTMDGITGVVERSRGREGVK